MKKLLLISILFFSISANCQSRDVTITFSEDNIKSNSVEVFLYDKINKEVIEIKGKNGVFNLPLGNVSGKYFIVKTDKHIVSIPSVNYDYPVINIQYFSYPENELSKFYGKPPKKRNTFYIHLGGCEDMFITTQKKKNAKKLNKIILKK